MSAAEPRLALGGKVALVSGGARGIGAAIARLFVERGASVLIGDVRAEGAALTDELGDAAGFVQLDVTREADWSAAVVAAEARFGPPDILVNNAGVLRLGAVDEGAAEDFALMMNVNLLGTVNGMRAVIPGMKARAGGSIVNIGSAAALVGYAGLAGYVASKHAVLGVTRAAALDLAPHGIRVNSVHPGQVRTPMTEGWPDAPRLTPMGRPAEAIEIARLVAFLAGDEASYSTGGSFVADGGTTVGLGGAVRRPHGV